MFRYSSIVLFSCYVLAFGFLQYGHAQNPNSMLHGEYVMTEFFTEDIDGSKSGYNLMVFDGDGGGSFKVLYSSSDDFAEGTLTYRVFEDGTFTMTIDGLILRGIVNTDGNSFTVAEMEEGEYGMYIGIRKSSGLTNSILDGTFIISGYFMENGSPVSALSAISFDGDGKGSIEGLYRSRDEIGTIPFNYTVDDDGSFSIDITGNSVPIQGIVNIDGESFTMANTDKDAFGLYYGIRKSQGMSDADLSGEYIVTGYVNEDVTSAEYVLAVIDGSGNGTLEIVYSSTGESFQTPFTYEIEDDGMIFITVNDEGEDVVMPGIVRADRSGLLFVNTLSNGFGVYAGMAKSDAPTLVYEESDTMPVEFTLGQNYPNPFNPVTTIHYTLQQPAYVRLTVYNVLGGRVRTLVSDVQPQGYFTVTWNGMNEYGKAASSGVYLYTLTIGGHKAISRRMLLKK